MDLPTADKEQCAAFIVSGESSTLICSLPTVLELRIRCSRCDLVERGAHDFPSKRFLLLEFES